MTAQQPAASRYETLYRRYALLAGAIIVGAVLLGIFFTAFFVLPKAHTRRELSADLAGAQQQIAEKEAEPSEEALREELTAFQAVLEQSASVFFRADEVSETLNKLYEYASLSEVGIAAIERQPGPAEETGEAYDAVAFRIKAVGTASDLIDFVARIREASFKSFQVHNLDLEQTGERHTLTMDVTLYTSPYSPGVAAQPTPIPTPAATPETLEELNDALDAAWAAGDWERAIDFIFQLADLAPDARDWRETLYQAYVNYGYQLLEQGATAEARTQFELALGLKPEGEEAQAGLDLIGAAPTPTPSTIEQLMDQLDTAWAAQHWGEAIRLLEQIRAMDPDYNEVAEKLYAARVNHGYTLIDQGRLDEAKIAFSQALAVRPNGEEALNGLRTLAEMTRPSTP